MEAKPYKVPHPFRKLNKKLINTIISEIAAGSPHQYAAECNGITETIFNMWRRQGRIDIEHDQDTLPAYLVVSLAKTKQKEIIWCREIIKESDKSHKGAEWTLEHAYWKHYSNNAPVQELSKEFEEFKNRESYGDEVDARKEMDSESEYKERSAASGIGRSNG